MNVNRRSFLKMLGIGTAVAVLPISSFIVENDLNTKAKNGILKLLADIERDMFCPSQLCQGAALEVENLSVTLRSVTFEDSKIRLHSGIRA